MNAEPTTVGAESTDGATEQRARPLRPRRPRRKQRIADAAGDHVAAVAVGNLLHSVGQGLGITAVERDVSAELERESALVFAGRRRNHARTGNPPELHSPAIETRPTTSQAGRHRQRLVSEIIRPTGSWCRRSSRPQLRPRRAPRRA
jgi:hypothetical protein